MKVRVHKTSGHRANPNKFALLLFVVAVAFQILMPFTQVMANASLGDAVDTVVICTPAGFVSYTMNADGSLSEKPDRDVQAAPCEFCQVCQIGGNGAVGVSSAITVVFAPPRIPAQTPNTNSDPFNPQTLMDLRPTRGPPS